MNIEDSSLLRRVCVDLIYLKSKQKYGSKHIFSIERTVSLD